MSQMQDWQIGTQSYIKLQNEIDKTSIRFQKASAKVDNLNDKLQILENQYKDVANAEKEVEIQGTITSNALSKGINKLTTKMKRYALSLFSIRSAYALVSRASSAYLSQDTALANKLQAVFIGLGSMLEPIISAISNTLIKAVKYINVFIKALTGVDLLSKAISKSMNKATSSSKAFSKALAGFDELTNLDTTTDTSSTGIDTSWADAFNDAPLDENVVKTIQDVADRIKTAWQWINENWKGVALGVAGVAGAFLLFKLIPSKSIGEVGTSFTGLLNGLGKAVEVIAILGGFALVISQVTNLIDVFGKSGLKVSDVVGLMATVFGTIVGLMTAIALIGPSMTAGLIPFSVLVAEISAILIVMALTIPTILEACSKFINNTAPSIQKILETIGNLVEKIIFALGTTLPPIINSVGNLFSKIFSGISLVIATVGNTIVNILNTAKSLVTTVLSSILSFINRLGPAINNFVDNAITAVTKLINFLISGINYLVNTLIVGGVNKIIKAVNSVAEYVGITIPTVPTMSIPKFVPQLAVGTNYVPEDQLAYIHKGEAVVPKKFNSQEYFGNGNEETNSLLEQVIEAIHNIEVNPYTTIKDVGRAAVSYTNSKSRQLGRSVIA